MTSEPAEPDPELDALLRAMSPEDLAATFPPEMLREALRIKLSGSEPITPDGDTNINVTCMDCKTAYTTSESYFYAGNCECPVCGSSKAQRV